MLKLPVAPTGKGAMPTQKGTLSTKERNLFSFSSDPAIKSKYKRYLGLQSSFSVFFPYNSFTAFIDLKRQTSKITRGKKRKPK